MPNHVYTKLTITGPIKQIKQFVVDVDGGPANRLDCDKVWPMPDELRKTSSPNKVMTQAEIDQLWADFNKLSDENKAKFGGKPFGLGMLQEVHDELVAKHGFDNWYDWSIANYGTKWGIYDTSEWSEGIADASLFYCTAWSPADKFFLNVSTKYPKLLFDTIYADEGGGFVGHESYQNGKLIESDSYDWNDSEGYDIREILGLTDDFEDDVDEKTVTE